MIYDKTSIRKWYKDRSQVVRKSRSSFFFYDFNVVTLPNTIIIVIVAIIIRIVIMIMIIGLSKICNHHFDNKIIDWRDIVPHRTHVAPCVLAIMSTI